MSKASLKNEFSQDPRVIAALKEGREITLLQNYEVVQADGVPYPFSYVVNAIPGRKPTQYVYQSGRFTLSGEPLFFVTYTLTDPLTEVELARVDSSENGESANPLPSLPLANHLLKVTHPTRRLRPMQPGLPADEKLTALLKKLKLYQKAPVRFSWKQENELKKFYPDLTDFRKFMQTMLATHQCPKIFTVFAPLKSFALSQYNEKKHESFQPSVLGTGKEKSIWCGYNDENEKYFSGTYQYDKKTKSLIQLAPSIHEEVRTSESSEPGEKGIYPISYSSDPNGQTYRRGGLGGDTVFFKLGRDIYLLGAAYLDHSPALSSQYLNDGFYGAFVVFTPDFFKNPLNGAPLFYDEFEKKQVLREIAKQITQRKTELRLPN